MRLVDLTRLLDPDNIEKLPEFARASPNLAPKIHYKHPGGGVLIGGIWGTYARQAGLDKLQEAAEESLWVNLEMLNTRMKENQVLFK